MFRCTLGYWREGLKESGIGGVRIRSDPISYD